MVATELRVLDRHNLPARIEDLRPPIERAETVDEATAYADDARSVASNRRWLEAIAAMSGEEAANVRRAYMEAVLWASRRIGEHLPDEGTGSGTRTDRGRTTAHPGARFATTTRQRLRALARLPIEEFEAELAALKESGREPSQAALLARARELGLYERSRATPPTSKPLTKAPVVKSDLEAVEAVSGLLAGCSDVGEQVLAVAVQLPDVLGACGLEAGATKRGLRQIADHLELAVELARELLEMERESAPARGGR